MPTLAEGDAYARARVRIAEVEAAFVLCQRVLLLLEPGEVRAECVPEPLSEGLGWAEGPRGALFYAVHVRRQRPVARVKIKSPSFSNWRVFPYTVHDSNMMDYAINEAQLRSHRRRLRPVGGVHGAVDPVWAGKREGDDAWPAEGGSDGQDGLLGHAAIQSRRRAGTDAKSAPTVCPTQAIEARDDGLFVDYGRCVVCQLCTEACPTGAMDAFQRLGVRCP